MKVQQETLIEELQKDVERMIDCVAFFKEQKDSLIIPPVEGKWSIAQILEHLNAYGRYYLPAIDRSLTASTSNREAWFNSGLLGNYFTNIMKPTNVFEIKNKMPAMKDYSPGSNLNPEVVMSEFLQQQQKLVQLLEISKGKSLNLIRVPISITRLLKLKLGDTFRFLVAHEQRHLIQARNTLKTIGLPTDKFPVVLRGV